MKTQPALLTIFFAGLIMSGCNIIPNRPGNTPTTSTKPGSVERAKQETPPTVDHSPSPSIFDQSDREKHGDDELLVYARRFGEMPIEGQRKEYAQITQSLSRNKKDIPSRLKAALIYSLPNSKFRDNAKAFSLLTELQREKALEEDIGALLSILRDYVEERVKIEDTVGKLAQKAKDEQRRADELQQKLDALKNIDKTMIERGQATQK